MTVKLSFSPSGLRSTGSTLGRHGTGLPAAPRGSSVPEPGRDLDGGVLDAEADGRDGVEEEGFDPEAGGRS